MEAVGEAIRVLNDAVSTVPHGVSRDRDRAGIPPHYLNGRPFVAAETGYLNVFRIRVQFRDVPPRSLNSTRFPVIVIDELP